ncbi:MAG: Maf family protein [Chthonomonadales bacterium]
MSNGSVPRLILASASPRRRDLLARLGIPFEVVPSGVEEDDACLRAPHRQEGDGDPELLALRLAFAKARDVARRASARIGDGMVVLGADTVVVVGEVGGPRVLGKPANAKEARAMLELLSGRTHQVTTGVAVGHLRIDAPAEWLCAVVSSQVRFRSLTPQDIAEYIATGEPMDKAGGYGIQGRGGQLVAAVDGDYTNVVGLPMTAVRHLLARWYPTLALVGAPANEPLRPAL